VEKSNLGKGGGVGVGVGGGVGGGGGCAFDLFIQFVFPASVASVQKEMEIG